MIFHFSNNHINSDLDLSLPTMAMKWRTMLTVLASFFPLIVIGDSLKEVQFSKKITSGIQNDLFGASVAVNEDIFVVGAPSDYRHYGSISIYNVKSNRSDAVAKIRSPGFYSSILLFFKISNTN